ncbi:MAG TPA: hypothetical protein PKA31_01320 [Candidatus Moranbacteria bacterium]|nr:hypothetical protein [Candidatus Moranbacteria bacterium]
MESVTPTTLVMFKYLLIVLAAGFGVGAVLNALISAVIIWKKKVSARKERWKLLLAGTLVSFFSMLGLLLFFVVSYFAHFEFRPSVLAVSFLALFLLEARILASLVKFGMGRFALAALFNIPYVALVAAPFFIRR